MNIEIANRLLQYRKSSGLSQEDLAEKIGVSRQAVSKWERAEASPDTDNLIILAQVYGVSLDELLNGESEPEAKARTEEKSDAPDENTTYVEDKRFSFKKGIHVNDGEDKVDISFKDGINVESKDGSHVHVGKDGVHVHDGEKVRAYTDENGHVMVDEEIKNHHRSHKKRAAHLVPVWAIALAGMLLWGFSGVFHGWALSWVCFLAIPLYHSFVDAVYKKNASHFAYPVLCVVIHIVTGFALGAWGINWIVYLTIPVYYGVISAINASLGKKEDN